MRSEEYKAKLNAMIKQMIKDEEVVEEPVIEQVEEVAEEDVVVAPPPLRVGNINHAIAMT
jgi:hypothetical protein